MRNGRAGAMIALAAPTAIIHDINHPSTCRFDPGQWRNLNDPLQY